MTSSELIDVLDRAAPGFRDYAGSEENYASLDTLHGVFIACSMFVEGRTLDERTWRRLADLVNQVVGGDDATLDEAAATYFLENLADPKHPLKPLLRGEALKYWELWEPQ